MPVRELSVWGRVRLRGVLARLRSRWERAAGVGARRGLCEGMRGGEVTDGLVGLGGGRYEGDWLDDKMHGRGIMTWANKDR